MEKVLKTDIMSGLLRFLSIRCILLNLIAVVLTFLFFDNHRYSIAIAFTMGVALSVLRFAAFERILRVTTEATTKTFAILISIVWYLLNLGIILVLFAKSIQISFTTLIAALLGTLSFLIVIMINTVTEALGITKNQFGQR
jgi:hypothetical protein